MVEYYDIVSEQLSGWLEGFVAALPNLVAAVLIAAAFGLLARFAAKLARRAAHRATDGQVLANLAGATTRYIVLAVGIFIALGVLGLQKTVTSLLAGAGIIGIALAFAFQDIAANFVAGVLMGFRRPFSPGEVVETNGYLGTVKEINLRNTLLETFSGQLVVLPNKEIFENPLVNFDSTGLRRVEIAVGVAYDSDLKKLTRVAREALEKLEFRASDKDVDVLAQGFGGSSIDFSLRYWIPCPGDVAYPEALHQGVLAVKQAFDENGIEIPFPIRTLDFSLSEQSPVVGRLSEMPQEARRRNGESKPEAVGVS